MNSNFSFERFKEGFNAFFHAMWLALSFQTREVNPRSITYRMVQRIKAMPWYTFSIALHVLLVLILMTIRMGWGKHPEEDLIIETTILEQEEKPVDTQKIEEIFANVSEVTIAQPTDFTSPTVAESDSVPIGTTTEQTQDFGAMMEEEGMAAVEASEQVLDGLITAPLGEGATMIVKGDVGGPGRNVGAFGLRKSAAGRSKGLKVGGGNKQTQSAVEAGLAFLAKVQQSDGHWSSAADGQFEDGGAGPADLAVTGLALLAFEGAGYTEINGKYQKNVQKAVAWLRQQQSHDGAWTHGGVMYGHGICSMAMSEAYGMAGERSLARDAAQAGIDYIAKVQGPTGGFGYGGPGTDMSVSGWQIFAVKSAKVAGLKISESTIEKMKQYLESMLDPSTGVTGYSQRGAGSSAMTAAGLCCRVFLGQNSPEEAVMQKIADVVATTGPQVGSEYYLYYGTLGMFQMGGKRWETWNAGFSMPLTDRQVKKAKYAGSWDPTGTQFGGHGGRVYVTCIYILCLEVYYRYLPVYR